MSTIGAGMMVDGVPLTPPRVSLLSSVDVVNETDPHFGNGLVWLPESCDVPDDPYWWTCQDSGGAAPSADKVVPAPPAIINYRPFDIWVGFRCSALQARQGDEFVARTSRVMDAFQSFLIEEELWTGAGVAIPASFENDFFLNTFTALAGGASTPFATALGELEQALATCQPGQIGVIHAQPRLVTLWILSGLVVPEPNGRRLRTALGTIVVPGAGYPGTGTGLDPATIAASWAYGTGMVRVTLGPTTRLVTEADDPGVMHGLNAAEIDRSLNTVAVRVERTVAATFDECCRVGVLVDLTAAL